MFDYSLLITTLFLLLLLVLEELPVYQNERVIFLFLYMTSPLCQVHNYRANENNLNADELHLFAQRLDISDIYMHEESCNKDKNSIWA